MDQENVHSFSFEEGGLTVLSSKRMEHPLVDFSKEGSFSKSILSTIKP